MAATDTAIRYRIDIAMSRFTVRAFATGLFSSMGHNPTLAIRDYTGESLAAHLEGIIKESDGEIEKLYRAGVSKSEIARRLQIGRTSVRRILG